MKLRFSLEWIVFLRAFFLAVSVCMSPLAPAYAQTPARSEMPPGAASEALERARALSAEGRFAEAAAVLGALVRSDPSHPDAWRLLALHQYWSGGTEEADRSFAAAVRHHPQDAALRVAYARFLMENGKLKQARRTLCPSGCPGAGAPSVAEADVILGTLAWWSGDLRSAARHFEAGLAAPGARADVRAEAAAGLAAIREGERPWIRLLAESDRDTQPLHAGSAVAEAGFFLTPLHSVYAEVVQTRWRSPEDAAPARRGAVVFRGYWPLMALETELSAGAGSHVGTAYATGRAAARLRLARGLRVGVRMERTPYRYTLASLAQNVMTTSLDTGADVDRAGWLGEAALRRERFPDGNTKTAAYAWLLAPLVRSSKLAVQVGYAYSFQHTSEHRFAPTLRIAPAPGNPPAWGGRYEPYYTPLHHHVHSATGSVRYELSEALTIRANGAYGFRASEEAPFVYTVGRAPVVDTFHHSIRPWNARAAATAYVRRTVSLEVEGAHTASAWYSVTSIRLSLHARF